jgi:hypothetical protein
MIGNEVGLARGPGVMGWAAGSLFHGFHSFSSFAFRMTMANANVMPLTYCAAQPFGSRI